ncbi:MAG: DUF1214 domain-containing protein [Myxococcota bacterium]
MDDATRAARLMDGTAWSEFCDTLKRAGQTILAPTSPDDPLDRAEGFRYLGRLARLALEKYVESDDPLAPRFYRLSHETAKIGCDNPDSFYQNAAISGAHDYRISGSRGDVAYLGFGTYYGDYGKGGRSGCSGYLEADELDIGEDGRFEIIVSQRPHPGNWLPMEPDSSMLIVRQNRLDKQRERVARLEIERIGADGPPAPLSAPFLDQRLSAAAGFVAGTAATFAGWAEGFARHPNELRPLDESVKQGAHGDPNIFFLMGYWELAPDQALVIEVVPPACDYWNFQLNNHWMESLDYRYHRVEVNRHSARLAPDGSLRLVVAHERPRGADANWLETAGHRRGTMGLRWVKAESHPQPRVRLVPAASLPVA